MAGRLCLGVGLSQTRLGTFRSLESEYVLIRARSSTCARAVERVDVRYGPFERSAPEDVPRAKPAPHANGTLRHRHKLTAPQPSSRGRRPPDRANNRNL